MDPLTINRFPIFAAWCYVIARRLGYGEEEAQSLALTRARLSAAARAGWLGRGHPPAGQGISVTMMNRFLLKRICDDPSKDWSARGVSAAENEASPDPRDCDDPATADRRRPKSRGLAAVRHLRHAAGGGVLLSGYGQAEDRRRALEAGFDRHLTKPGDPEELQRLLAARQVLAPGVQAWNTEQSEVRVPVVLLAAAHSAFGPSRTADHSPRPGHAMARAKA
jgi:CheY-like chemotaxis protein